MGKYILDAEGNPVRCDDVLVWARWFETHTEARTVGKDDVGDVHVSTVFLGIDHQFGHGEPLLYETMVFGGEHDGYSDRYSTREEALFGHRKAMELVRGVVAEDAHA